MGMSVARLLEAEEKYIEISRNIYDDPGTALAQEVEGIRTMVSRRSPVQEVLSALRESRDQFAQGQLDQGFPPFLTVIASLSAQDLGSPCSEILSEAGARMIEFGPSRMEYLILALTAIEKCIP